MRKFSQRANGLGADQAFSDQNFRQGLSADLDKRIENLPGFCLYSFILPLFVFNCGPTF